MFPNDLVRRAFTTPNGEFGWTREDVCLVVSILVEHRRAVLGGELWWVPEGSRDWEGLISQRRGGTAVYAWEAVGEPGEDWAVFVEGCARESLEAIERWPDADDLPPNSGARVLYNLTWTSEADYDELSRQAGRLGRRDRRRSRRSPS